MVEHIDAGSKRDAPVRLELRSREGLIKRVRELEGSADEGADIELLLLVDDVSSDVRERAVEALWSRGGTVARIGCRSCLCDAEWLVRDKAIEALGEIGSELDVRPIIRALSDTEWVVRATAASSIAGLHGQFDVSGAFPFLRDMLVNDESSDVRRYVAVALGAAFGESARPLLELQIGSEGEPGALVGVFSALYGLGDAERIYGILAMLDSDDSELLHQALSALEEVRPVDAGNVAERVSALLTHNVDNAVRSACEVLLARTLEKLA